MTGSSIRAVTGGNNGAGLATVDVGQLNRLALKGLVPMFDAGDQMFCFRLKRDGLRLVREGLSARYTIMSLLGLLAAERNGLRSPVDVRGVFGGLVADTRWIDNLGDLGLLLWLTAAAAPERLEEVSGTFARPEVLTRYPDGRESRTMELAWFLAGLAHAALALPAAKTRWADLAMRTYHLLVRNQGDHGIFGHLAARGTVSGAVRGRVGSFADQVYPIYALTRFAQAYQMPSALQPAHTCAEAICRVQGILGQWWWHYDAATGKVLQKYPVYAVHQDGMAPMALFALGEALNLDFTQPIYRGLEWITGENEISIDLRDLSSGAIWRNIHRRGNWKKYYDEVREFLRPGAAAPPGQALRILFECRPYHLGWLLYAFAGRT